MESSPEMDIWRLKNDTFAKISNSSSNFYLFLSETGHQKKRCLNMFPEFIILNYHTEDSFTTDLIKISYFSFIDTSRKDTGQ